MPVIQTPKPQKTLSDLIRAKVLRSDQIETCRNFLNCHPNCSSVELCDFLQGEEMITPFQHRHISEGHLSNLLYSHYILQDVVGKGSLGYVYRARRPDNNQSYAVKLITERNKKNISAYSEKLRDFSQFRSRTIVPLVHIFAHQGKVGLVWPYVDQSQFGATLDQLVRERGQLSSKETVLVALQLIKALRGVHQKNLFHGTLQPSNVIVTSKLAVRMLDFGIGFLMSVGRQESLLDTMTNASQIANHLDCSSPETINDASVRTPAGDRYSLGCIMYFCLTGQYPFPENNPVKKMLSHQFETPTPLGELTSAVPASLARIVHQLLEKEPEDRFASTDELQEQLESILNPKQPRVRPAPEPVPRPVAPSKEVPRPARVPQPHPSYKPVPGPDVNRSRKTPSNNFRPWLVWGGLILSGFLAGMLAYSLF